MNEQQVRELMMSSQTEEEWNDNTRKVKAACGGDYPEFWYAEIILSGVARDAATRWSGTDEAKIKITAWPGMHVPHAPNCGCPFRDIACPKIMHHSARPLATCKDHWHCDPIIAAHQCLTPDRRKPCPTCGETP